MRTEDTKSSGSKDPSEWRFDYEPTSHKEGDQKKLGQWSATAICGNDITSSCLYVAALCTVHAGCLAPIALLIVAFVLYLFRKVYQEVGDALPLNGGAYNSLLNSTTRNLSQGWYDFAKIFRV